MLSVESAIHRVRRDITLGVLLKGAFMAAVFACLWIPPPPVQFSALGAMFVAWVWLSATSARGSRLTASSPSLIAAGAFDEAEKQLDEAVRTFSLFRSAKLQALHHLATLRHAQQRWNDAAALSRALLGQRPGSSPELARASRLILAEASMELNDLRGAYDSIIALYRERLPLNDALALLAAQMDYEARIEAWDRMMRGIETKVALAELMPPPQAAQTQALLSLAAQKTGNAPWGDWLRRRVEILADVQSLCARRPMLGELWKAP